MTVKIIAENLIEDDHFLSATEQAGRYIGQPIADSGNTGSMRPITSGDENGEINDLTYDGTATSSKYNQINNHDFESYFTAGVAFGWEKFGASQTYAEETTIVHGGGSAQKVTCADDGETTGIAALDMSTTDTIEYVFSAWVYCNENTTVTLAHANLTGNSDDTAVNATTWTKITWEATADATGNGDAQIYRSAANSDVADYIIIDDVKFYAKSQVYITDTTLIAFASGTLIGATITFTSGTNNGESKTVTFNHGAYGYLQFSAVTADTAEGDTFTLTIDADDLDFEIEMDSSGDLGAAQYHWHFDGGLYPIGSENSITLSKHKEVINTDAGADGAAKVVETPSGDLLCIYTASDDDLEYKRSINQGISWGAATTISDADDYYLYDAIVLESGRIMTFSSLGAGLGTDIFYSDDNGTTWSSTAIHVTEVFRCVLELPNKNLLAFNDENDDIRCQISDDGGATWGSEITVVAAANEQVKPSATIAPNGDIVCVYQTDEDSADDEEIKCRISDDGGATWGSTIDVLDFVGDQKEPTVLTTIFGRIYVFAIMTNVDDYIYYTYSDDNGATWAAAASMRRYNPTLTMLRASVVFGENIWLGWVNSTKDQMEMRLLYRNYDQMDTLELSSYTAVNNIKKRLICDVNLQWHGASAVDGDKWTFEPEYTYAAKHIISNSPSKEFRSLTDNAECNIVVGTGANERYYVDGVAFFNTNFWDVDYQMNATDSWGSPSIDEDITFTLATGTVDAVSGNFIEDAALLADYKDHALAGEYFMPTSGTDSGKAWEIADNVEDYIVLDTTAAHDIAAADTFRIFGSKVAKTFTAGLYRYMRINIDAQHTSDDYYQIGTMIAGRTISLTNGWAVGYNKKIISGIEYLRPLDGGIVPIERADTKRVFVVSWAGVDDVREEAEALFDYLKGRNLALIPDSTDLTDVYCCKLIGDLEMQHWQGSKWNFSLTFEEV